MYSLPYQLRSENDQVVPNFWKNKVKRRELVQHGKTKWNEVKSFKIVQDRSKTNIFVSYCEEEEKQIKMKLRFVLEQSEENRIKSFLNYRRFAIAISKNKTAEAE